MVKEGLTCAEALKLCKTDKGYARCSTWGQGQVIQRFRRIHWSLMLKVGDSTALSDYGSYTKWITEDLQSKERNWEFHDTIDTVKGST